MELESQKLKAAIKQQLKHKKAKYADLAEHLECSIPTVKRILGEEELTLGRLLQILKFLDLTLTELELLASKGQTRNIYFTKAQEEFLVKNPAFFAYLMELYKDETPAQIAATHKLTQRSTDKYLIGLERVELIRVTGKQKVKPAYDGFPSLKDGPLAKAYYQSFIQTAADFFIKDVGSRIFAQQKPDKEEPKRFSVEAAPCSTESYRKLNADFARAFEDFQKACKYEQKTMPEEQLKTAVVLLSTTYVDSDNKDLKALETVFGKIENL